MLLISVVIKIKQVFKYINWAINYFSIGISEILYEYIQSLADVPKADGQ